MKTEISDNILSQLREEIANGITHGIGVLLSIAALVLMIVTAVVKATAWHVVGVTIFGSSLILLYLASTLYHSIQHLGAKKLLRRFDHGAIFVLIAGTYTPFVLTVIRGPWGWSLFGVIWGLALMGIVFKILATGKLKKLSLFIYVLMGWLVVIAAKPLFSALPTASIFWLILGGVVYTLGVIFYRLERMPFNHAVWHLFVLGGSISHFFSVMSSM